MSLCRLSDALLDASFAGTDLSRAQAEHVRECAECARATSRARRFERELGRVGEALTPEPMPAMAELAGVPVATEGYGRMWRRNLGAAVALVALVAVVFGGSQWLGGFLRDGLTRRPGAAPISAAAAAAMVGVPPDEVLVTEDGAIAIRDLGLPSWSSSS